MIALGLGSNVGNPVDYLRKAVALLREELRVQAVSPLYESDAMLLEGASSDWNRPFVNGVLLAEWRGEARSPESLLVLVKEIEKRLGREARGRWAPREIDIDVLLIDDQIVRAGPIELPHPGLIDRPFVLLPLADVLPDWRHPVSGLSVRELASRWSNTDPERVPFRTHRSPVSLTELVGILNVTPDSFSDGGLHLHTGEAVRQARALVEAGATVLDIGAESTRPGAVAVDPAEEWRRLEPILSALAEAQILARLSLDSRHTEVVANALRPGAPRLSWVNDVGGEDPALRRAVADSDVDYVFMHQLGVPPTRDHVLPEGVDPVGELLLWAEARVAALGREGIARHRLIFDPGIGFGKTPQQTLLILSQACRFRELGVRILFGHSRKSFLRKWVPGPERPPADRDLETSLLCAELARQGVDFLRVHDVERCARAMGLSALLGVGTRC